MDKGWNQQEICRNTVEEKLDFIVIENGSRGFNPIASKLSNHSQHITIQYKHFVGYLILLINVFIKINEINSPKINLLLQWSSPDRHYPVEYYTMQWRKNLCINKQHTTHGIIIISPKNISSYSNLTWTWPKYSDALSKLLSHKPETIKSLRFLNRMT